MAVLIKVVVDRTFIKLLALKALGYFCGVGGVVWVMVAGVLGIVN